MVRTCKSGGLILNCSAPSWALFQDAGESLDLALARVVYRDAW